MPDNSPKKKTIRINFTWFYVILIIAIGWMLFGSSASDPVKIEWQEVEGVIASGDVKEIRFIRNEYKGYITIRNDRLGSYTDHFGGKAPRKSPHFYFLVSDKFNPEETFGAANEALAASARDFKLIIDEKEHIWGSILEWLLFPLMLILMWVFMFRGIGGSRSGGGSGGGIGGGFGNPFSMGRATGKLIDKDAAKVTFKDVAGLHGAKEEVMELVDFLKNPKKYTVLGARIPKGALLVGPPGTGKTLLAKAVAGEAGVPFFSMSGSDFNEMFVGVGSSRMRDLFRQAKEKAPCIIFIDEIDSVGRVRTNHFSGQDTESANTLNQLLTEMDGFSSDTGVIVLAATNRADILDKALTRAGRFDRQIHVELPELGERKEIFQVHLRGIKLAPDFDLDFMARHTPGFSGADIANVCNEAAIGAARKSKPAVERQDFMDAIDRMIGGLERSGSIMTPAEKKSVAHHEAGHAAISWLLPYANPLFKVTLIPRGRALGAAWYLPEERKLWTRDQMLDEMCSLIGGRVAEEIINGQPSTGAQNDLERLTQMAYAMIQYYGMSDKVGLLSFYDSTGSRGYEFSKPYSEKTAEMMDEEVRILVEQIHDRAYKILTDNMEGFLKMAALLLEKEVIFADDVEKILGPKVLPSPEERAVTEESAETNEVPESTEE